MSGFWGMPKTLPAAASPTAHLRNASRPLGFESLLMPRKAQAKKKKPHGWGFKSKMAEEEGFEPS